MTTRKNKQSTFWNNRPPCSRRSFDPPERTARTPRTARTGSNGSNDPNGVEHHRTNTKNKINMAKILSFEAQQVINAQRRALETQDRTIERLKMLTATHTRGKDCNVVRLTFN